ncbi:MAG: hypothetical protein RSA27_05180, partial [Oscillospiraceae bacterium]
MKNNWTKLDNAAKIFPSASSRADTQVFRIACELNDKIEPRILQTALDETLEELPLYQCVLKRGVFWYYLDNTDLKPTVKEEYRQPCSKIYSRNAKSLLFEVTYYKKRINLDVYHVLSDGTGAALFLTTLVTKYICKIQNLPEPSLNNSGSVVQMETDSFKKYYTGEKTKKQTPSKNACRLKGLRLSEDRTKILTGNLSVKKMLAISHEYKTSLTALICTCLMLSIIEVLPNRARRKPVVISVPVNLRKQFPSETVRNFFSVSFVSYDFLHNPTDFETVLESLTKQIKANTSHENLEDCINRYTAVERNVFSRVVPLILKDFFLKCAYLLNMKKSTATISNIGVIEMPKELKPYIHGFDMYNTTNKLQGCV